MGLLRTAALFNIRKFPAQSFIRNHNKFWSKQKSTFILPKIKSNCRNLPSDLIINAKKFHINHSCCFDKYKSIDSFEKKNNNVKISNDHKTSEKLDNIDENIDKYNKTAKVLPIVLHQVTGQTDNAVAVPYKKEIPQWMETDSVSEATKAMEEFTDDFLKTQQVLESVEVDTKDDNINKYDKLELDEIESDIEPYPSKQQKKLVDLVGSRYDIHKTDENVISFRLDPKEFSHLPISAMNLKFDMEMPDLAYALKNTRDNSNIIPLGFNAKIRGTVDLDDNKVDGEKLEDLEFEEISHMVSSLAANICAVALQKVIVEKNKDHNKKTEDDDEED